jgi:hypothetical protein
MIFNELNNGPRLRVCEKRPLLALGNWYLAKPKAEVRAQGYRVCLLKMRLLVIGSWLKAKNQRPKARSRGWLRSKG